MRLPVVVPGFVLVAPVLLAACGGGHAGHGADSAVADGAREIAVTAEGTAFDPEQIRIAPDEDVAIVLTSADGEHDFTIDELDAHVAVGPGDTATGGVKADEPGRYEFYCSVPGHRSAGMEGVLFVE